VRRPVAIRGLLACASIAALFFMHGPSAAAGCPGGQLMSVSEGTFAGSAGASMTGDMMGDAASPHSATVDSPESPGIGLGQVCVSRPPRLAPLGPLALTLLVAIVGLAASADWPHLLDSYTRRRRRAPPTGRTLLHILCVSRT
jgi:hypothetical protein